MQQEKNNTNMKIGGAVALGILGGFFLFSSSNGCAPPTSQSPMYTPKKK